MLKLLAAAIFATTIVAGQSAYAHSGGCRKSSPPGKCCHMEKASGVVHCH